MNSNDTRGPRHGRGNRRPSNRNPRRDDRGGDRRGSRDKAPGSRTDRPAREEQPRKLSFWGKILAFFTGGAKKQTSPARPAKRDTRTGESRGSDARKSETANSRRATPPERVEVSSPKLYVGNLSYDATESDLAELFNGVGKVQNAEVVTHKGTYRSKGFGFVTMLTVDEARRAVQELHDKSFMGRKLVVSGSKSEGPRDA